MSEVQKAAVIWIGILVSGILIWGCIIVAIAMVLK